MSDRALRPFWIHQMAEYLIGVAIVSQGLQSTQPLVPVLAGVAVIVNAAVVRGPMSAFRWVTRRLHRWLDVAVMGLVVVAIVQPWIESDSGTRVVLAIILLPLAFLWFYTDWADKPARKDRRRAQAGGTGETAGRAAGRAAGNAYNAIKSRAKK